MSSWDRLFSDKQTRRISIKGMDTLKRKMKAIEKSIPYIKIKIGPQSRGKLNKKKAFFAAKGGFGDRQPERSPVYGFFASGNEEVVKEEFAFLVKEGINAFFKTPGVYAPLSFIRKAVRPALPDFAELFKEGFEYIEPPITKRLDLHRDTTPLIETGRFIRSVKAKFVRAKKKKK